MTKKLVILSEDVAAALDNEDNSSALIDALLHIHFQIPLDTTSRASLARAEIIRELTTEPQPPALTEALLSGEASVLSDEPTISDYRDILDDELGKSEFAEIDEAAVLAADAPDPALASPEPDDQGNKQPAGPVVYFPGDPRPAPAKTAAVTVPIGKVCPKCAMPLITLPCLHCFYGA